MEPAEKSELKRLIKAKEYLHKDYYEYFCDLGDKPIKEGYEKLIKDILPLAGLDAGKSNFQWSGSFESEKDAPEITLSCGTARVTFNLRYEVEMVDLTNLLGGLNSLIESCRPGEERRFCLLPIYNDQTDCVWFVTERQLPQLCLFLHVSWRDFPDHCCPVTRAAARKKRGRKGELALCRRAAEREWRRLSGIKWEVYPAKK